MSESNPNTRCPRCDHWWVSHGVPDEPDYGCLTITSSAAERWTMSDAARRLEREGVDRAEAGRRAFAALQHCGCTLRDGNPVTARQVRCCDCTPHCTSLGQPCALHLSSPTPHPRPRGRRRAPPPLLHHSP